MDFKIKRSIFIAMLFNICFFSCKAPVDVTEKLDTRVPSVRITYPEEECPVIRNSFTLKGVVKDDGKIEKITVTLKSTSDNTGKEYAIDCSQEKNVNSWNWKIALNIPGEDGKFPLNDGKYSATVIATDADGKKGKATYSFIIDNTPPMLFLYGNPCNNIKD